MKLTSLAHFLGGALTALTTVKFPVLGSIMVVLFIIYEVNEDWHLSNKAFKDILEFMVGVYVSATAMLAWGLIC